MRLDPLLHCIAAHHERIRIGLDVGYTTPELPEKFRALRGGVWASVPYGEPAFEAFVQKFGPDNVARIGAGEALPFASDQFELVVLEGSKLTQPLAREIHRVLNPKGNLYLTVVEQVRRGKESTLSRLYQVFLRYGYNIVSVIRPPWWKFGFGERTLTICASKKNWHENVSTLGVPLC